MGQYTQRGDCWYRPNGAMIVDVEDELNDLAAERDAAVEALANLFKVTGTIAVKRSPETPQWLEPLLGARGQARAALSAQPAAPKPGVRDEDETGLSPGEREVVELVTERDDAEEFGSHLFYLVTGRSPEWSNHFGYAEATQDVDDALRLLRASAKSAPKPGVNERLLEAARLARTLIVMARQGAGCRTDQWARLLGEISAAIADAEQCGDSPTLRFARDVAAADLSNGDTRVRIQAEARALLAGIGGGE